MHGAAGGHVRRFRQQHDAGFVRLEINRDAGGACGQLHALLGHQAGQAAHARHATANAQHAADLAQERGRRRLC
jgi:hypothetical protein